MVHAFEGGRAGRRLAKRQAILDAAWALVTEGGVEALTLQRLAKRLGSAVGAVYRYFSSKEAILAAIEASLLRALADRMGTVTAAARAGLAPRGPDGALAVLLAQVRLYARLPEARPEEFRLISFALGDPRILVPDDEDARAVLDAARPLFLLFAGCLEEAAAAGAIRPGPAVDRALVIWSGLHGVLQTKKLGRVAPELVDTPRLVAEFVQSILRGWGAQEEDIVRAWGHLDELDDALWA